MSWFGKKKDKEPASTEAPLTPSTSQTQSSPGGPSSTTHSHTTTTTTTQSHTTSATPSTASQAPGVTTGGGRVDKEGWLLKKPETRTLTRGRRYKQRWVALVAGTLYVLDKGSAEDQVESEVALAGARAEPGQSRSHKWQLEVKLPGGADPLKFAASGEKERDEWLRAIARGATQPANTTGPPVSEWSKKETLSLKMRAEKKLASAALDTKKGRAYLKQQIPDDSAFMVIWSTFVEFLSVSEGKDAATLFEKTSMKLLAKAVILDKYELLSTDAMLPGLEPMLRVVEKGQDADTINLDAVVIELKELFAVCREVLRPHCSPNTMGKMELIFATLTDLAKLNLLFSPKHFNLAERICGQLSRIYPTLRAEVLAVRESDKGKAFAKRQAEKQARQQQQLQQSQQQQPQSPAAHMASSSTSTPATTPAAAAAAAASTAAPPITPSSSSTGPNLATEGEVDDLLREALADDDDSDVLTGDEEYEEDESDDDSRQQKTPVRKAPRPTELEHVDSPKPAKKQ